MSKELVAVLYGVAVGMLKQDKSGAFSFKYSDQAVENNLALSLFMPVRSNPLAGQTVRVY